MVKYTDIYSVRSQIDDISLRHASNRCAPQMITLAVATARLTILDRLVRGRSFTWFLKYFFSQISSNSNDWIWNWVLSVTKKLKIAGFLASLPFLTYLCNKRLKPSIHCVQL